ncbi:uncharacterized protein RCO7_01428 [Rhynchosporium graminicola]|uniref:BTB domain-containing protein n=1 Tax=Rhynchosporium graminicola TaxID=2792576 RepID=A0A1E1JZK3_9HELO|nr:uncharacterized protein RCO7_01428 [Rhynchosporium commune]
MEAVRGLDVAFESGRNTAASPQVTRSGKRCSESPPPAPRKKSKGLKCFSDSKAERIDIHVGEPGQIFSFFFELITEQSPFFEKAFERKSASGQTKVLIFKGDGCHSLWITCSVAIFQVA